MAGPTLSSTVANHIMSEVMAKLSLSPLRSKYVALPLINASSIDGVATTNRKIPKRTQIAEAVDDTEGVDFNAYEQFAFTTSITLTPTGKVQGINPTIKSLRRIMGGATREAVIAAIESGSAESLPVLRQMAEEIIAAHYRAAERATLALFAGLSGSKGTTNTALSFATLVDAQTDTIDNNVEHRALACVVSEKGIGDLRKELISGANTGIAALWSNGMGEEFAQALGEASPSQAPSGNVLGMPIFGADVGLMTTANAGVDSVGAVFALGRGETATPGSLRGFAEFCEGHALSLGMKYDLEGDNVQFIGRYEWAVGEHTDEHGVQLIYKKT